MDSDLLQRIEALERKLGQVVVRGRIHAVDHGRHLAKVEYGAEGQQQTTGWLPWKPQRTGKTITWSPPDIGEGATVISEGDLTLGEIIPGSYYNQFPTPSNDKNIHITVYADGAKESYNQESHHYEILLPASGTVKIVATGGVEIEGDVKVIGNIKATGDITDHTRSMQGDRDIYNGHGHDVPGHGTAVPTGNKQ
ncbi:phage baseplate assembly protein V [Spartinivicinus poritis]|uniref:Phage baseplate assembly protein V n=1 Tax=Spartinivicinus poritis TaxID=2994640 RepID=A0ABT5UF22_9GAMM|nr:phage baseplate assembly protein V [Spartinivicinus sp. A2-2]MDE1464790.1 phage baseplate assembly protein V [Spartinivicinus sp. A2-2]